MRILTRKRASTLMSPTLSSTIKTKSPSENPKLNEKSPRYKENIMKQQKQSSSNDKKRLEKVNAELQLSVEAFKKEIQHKEKSITELNDVVNILLEEKKRMKEHTEFLEEKLSKLFNSIDTTYQMWMVEIAVAEEKNSLLKERHKKVLGNVMEKVKLLDRLLRKSEYGKEELEVFVQRHEDALELLKEKYLEAQEKNETICSELYMLHGKLPVAFAV